ncbi:MAG: flagellar motor switch protein FliG [Actinomycetota bacterium]|nr:flagellar motor switch protein FliG [Actinomycetota bacterium]MDE3205549.1 flagellar motor switch protein FliG [Acidobacteriota bacterium]
MAPLTGSQRAAIVIAQLDDDRAAKVLRSMSEIDVLEIMSAMVGLPALEPDEVTKVLQEFNSQAEHFLQVSQGGVDVARKLLRDRLGGDRAEEVLVDLVEDRDTHPLGFLQRIDVRQVGNLISEEHPQTIAVILAHLPADAAAQLLADMEESAKVDIVRRLATMRRVSPVAIRIVAEVLESEAAALLRTGAITTSAVGGMTPTIAILNLTDRVTEKQILTRLEQEDPALAESIRNQMFVFDDLAGLDDRSLQLILRHAVPKDLAVALKAGNDGIREQFLRNMSERASEDLQEEIESLGPIRVSQVESAQSAIVKIVRDLEAAGDIVLARGDDEYV